MERLKQGIVETIQNDYILFGKVAHALDIRPSSLIGTLRSNRAKLTQASVLRVLKDHLNITKDSDLLTELPAPVLPSKKLRRSKQKQAAA